MIEHPDVARLRRAGFTVLPSLDAYGFDTGLLFARRVATHLEVVSAWRDDFALVARLPYARDWTKPFEATLNQGSKPVSFAQAVDWLLTSPQDEGYGDAVLGDEPQRYPEGER